MDKEIRVNLVSGRSFVVEPAKETNPLNQAHGILEHGATERLDNLTWTVHPPRQIESVTVQPRGTGAGGKPKKSEP